MRGEVTFHFYPQGDYGYFEVEKKGTKRRYTPEKVFDLELKNWELVIDNAPTKKGKLQAANNAIFKFRKDYLEYTHSIIEPLKEKAIKHLQHIIEYINSSFEDSPIPQQMDLVTNNWEGIQPPNNDEYDTMFNLLGLYRDKYLQRTYIKNEMINPPDIETALTYHIPQVLQKHNLTPKVAVELLDRLKSVHKASIMS